MGDPTAAEDLAPPPGSPEDRPTPSVQVVPVPPPPPPKPFKAPRPARTPVESSLPWAVRWGMPLLVFLVAFNVYHAHVEKPSIIDFDEAHYVKVARNFTRGVLIDPSWAEPRPQNFEHPPLGKYLMALGIYLNGKPHNEMENQAYIATLCNYDNPECARDAYAWRISSVWVGALGVVGMYWLGLRLFNRLSAGVLASGLLLLDGFYYIHARLAMLDVYPIAFALLALGVALGRTRGHRWVSSVLFGCALGSKFPALFLVPAYALLQFLLSRERTLWMRIRDALIKGAILPLGLFVLLFAPFLRVWFHMGGGGLVGAKFAVDTFIFVEHGAFTWTYGADATHPYTSAPYTWLALTRPVFYFVSTLANGDVGHIYAMGNPFLWWTAAPALLAFWLRATPRWFLQERVDWRPAAFLHWLKRPFAFTRETSLWYASLLFATAYGPYFLVKRAQFNFYFLLAAPFLSLLLAGFLSEAWARKGTARLLVVLFAALAAMAFVFYFPIYSGEIITQKHFDFVFNSIRWMRR